MIAAVEALNYRKGVRYFLQDITWHIHKGEKWLVMGSNGSGKTTLVSILAGYREYSEGTLTLFEQAATRDNIEELRKSISFISSSYYDRCFNDENGFDIILGGLNGQLGPVAPIESRNVRKAKQLMIEFGLGHRGMYPFNMLSRGQQQKVLLARGFMSRAKLHVFDEPCGGLDLLSRVFFLNTVSAMLAENRITLIYVTHHTEEILPGFTHALLLDSGRIHSQGKLKDVFTDENISSFLGVDVKVIESNGMVSFNTCITMSLKKELWKNEAPYAQNQ